MKGDRIMIGLYLAIACVMGFGLLGITSGMLVAWLATRKMPQGNTWSPKYERYDRRWDRIFTWFSYGGLIMGIIAFFIALIFVHAYAPDGIMGIL